MLWVARFSDSNPKPPLVQITSGFRLTSSAASSRIRSKSSASVAIVDHKVGTFPPPELLEALHKYRYSTLQFWIAFY